MTLPGVPPTAVDCRWRWPLQSWRSNPWDQDKRRLTRERIHTGRGVGFHVSQNAARVSDTRSHNTPPDVPRAGWSRLRAGRVAGTRATRRRYYSPMHRNVSDVPGEPAEFLEGRRRR